jgi:hypothetical protein
VLGFAVTAWQNDDEVENHTGIILQGIPRSMWHVVQSLLPQIQSPVTPTTYPDLPI